MRYTVYNVLNAGLDCCVATAVCVFVNQHKRGGGVGWGGLVLAAVAHRQPGRFFALCHHRRCAHSRHCMDVDMIDRPVENVYPIIHAVFLSLFFHTRNI